MVLLWGVVGFLALFDILTIGSWRRWGISFEVGWGECPKWGDRPVWGRAGDGNFSIKRLCNDLESGRHVDFPTNVIWKSWAPSKEVFYA